MNEKGELMDKSISFASFILRHKFTRKLLLSFAVIFLIITSALAFRYYYLSKNLVPQYEKLLQRKINEQIAAITSFLNENEKNLKEIIKDENVLNFMELLQSKNIISNKIQENNKDYIQKLQENLGFKSLSLLDNWGNVLFSTNSSLSKVKLQNEVLSNAPLFRSFFAAYMTLSTDFSDFLYSPIIKEPAFYVTTPAIKDKKLLGIIAYQIDETELTAITRDYLDLGDTGEVVLAVQTESEAHFITPTRNDPTIRFTKRQLFGEADILKAARGEKGTGIGNDYRGITTVSTWAFIPRVDWGIVVKLDLSEVNKSMLPVKKLLMVFSLLTVLFIFLSLLVYGHKFSKLKEKTRFTAFSYIPKELKHFSFFALLIFIYLSIMVVYQFKEATDRALLRSQESAISQIKHGVSLVNDDLERIRRLAEFIAQDLQTERLISEDIRKRLRRDIVETEGLVRITIAYAPFKRSSNIRLYAPTITQQDNGSIVENVIESSYDYTDENEGLEKTQWYRLAIKSGEPQWLNPSRDPLSNSKVIIYSMPFYYANETEKPAGVISISYKLSRFTHIAQNIGVGETGYTFLIAKDGTFLYHPIRENVNDKKSLLQFAQAEGNNDLGLVANQMKEGKPLLKHLFNKATDRGSWIYSHPIPMSGWTIATVFFDSEIGLGPTLIRKYLFKIVMVTSIMLLLLLLLFCRFYAKKPRVIALNFSNLILTLTLISLWYTIDETSGRESKNHVLITDQSSINKFVNKQKGEAKRKNEPPPIPIPVGIELYSLQQSSPKAISFSGYIWHKYHKVLHEGVPRLIRIPQATKFTILNQTKFSEGDWDIVGMNLTATLYHEHDYRYYPFEQRHIVIPLEHADYTRNILLVPDLEGYVSTNPYQLPGLDTTFSMTSFYATETFFDYTPFKPNADVGVRQYLELTDQFRLAYNAIIDVDLLVPFIFFFLPLLVILFSIFAVLMLEEKQTDPYKLIGPFTGLFFALVLLHRSLHEAAPATRTVYIEYAFFFAYLIIILLVTHAILLKRFVNNDFYQMKVVPFLKTVFWPLQLSAWIITTWFIFY